MQASYSGPNILDENKFKNDDHHFNISEDEKNRTNIIIHPNYESNNINSSKINESNNINSSKVNVDQTVIQGDYVDDRDTTYVDDRDTIIQDSVVSKSNIGASGDDKFAKLDRLAEMKEKGLIDDDEFKLMKNDILGK